MSHNTSTNENFDYKYPLSLHAYTFEKEGSKTQSK